MSSSAHIDNKKKRHISSRKRTNTGIRTYFNCRKNVLVNFTVTKKILYYWETNSYLFVNSTEIYTFKAKDFEIVASPLCWGNISKDWSTDNMKRTEFTGCIYDFSVDYDDIAVDDIKNIHKYLMKKNDIV